MSALAQLEHFCGYGGKHPNTVRYHSLRNETLIYTAAAAIIIEDVNDPHKQEFLRGHDNEVSALDISANGKLVATGQIGSLCRKGAVAPVIVWDFDNRQKYVEFGGLAHAVLCVKFSDDGRFLVATGANQMIFVWDVQTAEVIYSRRTESPCYMAVWGPVLDTNSRYPSYQLCTTFDSQVLVHLMSFDVRSMCYALTSDPMQIPASGLQRKYLCGLVKGGFLLAGTAAGDMCVFSMTTKVFRAAIPVCNNGVTSLTQAGDMLFAAGGDGRVKALRGQDTNWDIHAENVLPSGVMALTASCDGAELVAGCRNGSIFRLLSKDLAATLQAVTHTDEVTSVAFGTSSDSVLTCSKAGEVVLQNLSDYMPVVVCPMKSSARSAVLTTSTGEIVAGYDDGMIRCWPAKRGSKSTQGTYPAWELQAHRGGVTVVRESVNFIVSGGNDCSVRFWHRTSRELLATFTNHRKPVADLFIDEVTVHQVHSGAEDKLMVTYDLKQNKPLVQHYTQQCMITGLSQRKDRDREVISCGLDGRMLFWDPDYPDPTGELKGTLCGVVARLKCVDVSPSGRYVAAGAEDARLYIYDLAVCACIQECEGHSDEVVDVRWSPDQKQIVSAGKDGCVVIWNFFEM